MKRESLKSIDPFDLRVSMMRKKITASFIGKQLGVTRQAVTNALRGSRKALLPKIEKIVNKE